MTFPNSGPELLILIMISILLLISIIISTPASAQHRDYKAYRDSFSKLSCAPADSFTVAQTIHRLSALDSTQFDENFDLYYKDLGWAYYRLFMHNKDTSFVRLSVNTYLHQPEEKRNYWNMAFSYMLLNDCEKVKAYLQLYLDHTDPQYLQPKEAIERMRRHCPE